MLASTEPPPELTESQTQIWRDVVASEGIDASGSAMREAVRDFVVHRDSVVVLNAQVAAFDVAWMAFPDGLQRYDQLLKMRDREVRACAAAAARIRAASTARGWEAWS